GAVTDTFSIKLPTIDTGWTVAVYDAYQDGTNVTEAALSTNGWITPQVSSDDVYDFRVEVTVANTIDDGDILQLPITVESVSAPGFKDTVKASTTKVTQPIVDLMIRKAGESTYVGSGVYNASGTDQRSELNVIPTFSGTYQLSVVNNGTTAST